MYHPKLVDYMGEIERSFVLFGSKKTFKSWKVSICIHVDILYEEFLKYKRHDMRTVYIDFPQLTTRDASRMNLSRRFM